MPPSALHESLYHFCHLLPLLCGLIVSEVFGSVSENALSGKFSQVKCKMWTSQISGLMQLLARKTVNNCINQPFCAIVTTKNEEQLHTKKDVSERHLLCSPHLSSVYFQYSNCERYPSYCERLSASARFSGLGMWLIRKSIRASFESYKYLPSL